MRPASLIWQLRQDREALGASGNHDLVVAQAADEGLLVGELHCNSLAGIALLVEKAQNAQLTEVVGAAIAVTER